MKKYWQTFSRIRRVKKIFPSIFPVLLLSGCFWYGDPWEGDALVTQLAGVPCFGLPEKEIVDPKLTKISTVIVSQSDRKLWVYSERDYKNMQLAASACVPYRAGELDDKLSGERSGGENALKSGEIYRVLVRSRRESNKFNRTFYYAYFCFRQQGVGEITIFQLEGEKGYVCPEK